MYLSHVPKRKLMRTLTLLMLFCIGITNRTTAQTLRYTTALPYTQLAAYSNMQKDPLSFTGNQAALATTDQAAIGLYGERRFMLAATSFFNAAAVLPTRAGNIGLQCNYSGFKNFTENNIGLAYAKSLGSKVDIGIQFNYYGYRIPVYGAASTVNIDAGIIVHLTDRLNGGMQLHNPVGGKFGKQSSEKLASAYAFGLGYDASDNCFVSTIFIKEEDQPVNIVAGVQYQFAQQFFMRIGVNSNTASVFAGIGAAWKKMRVDIAANYHPQLGFSPGILFLSYFGKKK